jgi:hypothetical protein
VDIVGTADLLDDISWWENDGSENFTHHAIPSNFSEPGPICATQLDGDSDLDIIAGGPAFAWWESDGSQTFMRHTISSRAAPSFYVVDVDGDGDADIVAADEWWLGITWWENP